VRAVDRLAAYLVDGSPASVALVAWLNVSPRFRAFVEVNRDKVRKKLRGAADPAALRDVLAELDVARRLLANRRVELTYEAYGAGKRGPDFTVTFRAAHRFNLEVTRPRSGDDLAGTVLAKLPQLPADLANVVLVSLDAPPADFVDAMRTLKSRADGRPYQRRTGVVVAAPAGALAWPNPEARLPLLEGAETACLRALQSGMTKL